MNLLFIDNPRYASTEAYTKAIGRMVERLNKYNGTVAIYQIGSVSTPGISDIDMLVVFEDGARCDINPLENLFRDEEYFFIHRLYGASRSYFNTAQTYTFFHNYNLLWGEDLPVGDTGLPGHEVQMLKNQIALEYLTKMFITLTVQITYRIIKVRALLLHVRGLTYDLDFLNVDSGRLYELVMSMNEMRRNWFNAIPSTQLLNDWVSEFYAQIEVFLETNLKEKNFYFPRNANFKIAGNMSLKPSISFGHTHKGVKLPQSPVLFMKKYFNLMHRFNFFNFNIPISKNPPSNVITERFKFLTDIKSYNRTNLSHFTPLTTDLDVL
jgi:hypothetical protein